MNEIIKSLQELNEQFSHDKLHSQEELSKAMLQLSNSKILKRQLEMKVQWLDAEAKHAQEQLGALKKESEQADLIMRDDQSKSSRDLAQLLVQQ